MWQLKNKLQINLWLLLKLTMLISLKGHIGVQWAKKRGCHVIGMTSSEEKAKLLSELGADRIINYRTENLDQVLTKEYPEGVDVVWETIGGKVFETLFKHLAPKGRFVVVGGISGYKEKGFHNVHIPNLPTTVKLFRIPYLNDKKHLFTVADEEPDNNRLPTVRLGWALP